MDRTSLTVSDEEFERNVEASVSEIAEENREVESLESKQAHQRLAAVGGVGSPSTSTPRASTDSQHDTSDRGRGRSSSEEEESAPVAGLLRTIQKPLTTIGKMFSDDTEEPAERQPAAQSGTSARLSPEVYKPPRNSGESPRSGTGTGTGTRTGQRSGSEDSTRKSIATARQASAEEAEARKIHADEHSNVVETLSHMFPNLDRDVIDDVVKMKQGR